MFIMTGLQSMRCVWSRSVSESYTYSTLHVATFWICIWT